MCGIVELFKLFDEFLQLYLLAPQSLVVIVELARCDLKGVRCELHE